MKTVYRKLTYMMTSLAVLGGVLFPPGGAANQARAQLAEPSAQKAADQAATYTGYTPITIADYGPVTTNAFSPSWTAVSGDWAAYAAQSIVCGHCGMYTHTLYAHNVITGEKITVNSSTLRTFNGSEMLVGASNMHLAYPLLTWDQPASPERDPQGYYTPGDYNCTSCYYNLQTHQAGQLGGQPMPQNPPGDFDVKIVAAPYPSPLGDTITVVRHSTGEVVMSTTLEDGWHASLPAAGTDKFIFFKTKVGYAVPQLIQLIWLAAPDPAFQKVWQRADEPVAQKKVARSWLWGPGPITTAIEPYLEGVNGQRTVQYYDKSRMEVNNPSSDMNDLYYVTNGLLTVEMIGSEIQIGNATMITASVPCTIPVAGDTRAFNPLTPGYSALRGVATIHGENKAQSRVGQPVDDAIDVNGVVSKYPLSTNRNVYAAYASETSHNVPDVFWTYLQGMQAQYGFPWTFVLGYPITEAYWTQMRVDGRDMPVLVQAYQRRVLTYTPGFPEGWKVQQGNVGQHYLEWRTSNMMNKLPTPDIAP